MCIRDRSVADQEAIKALFPNTYGMPLITFEAGEAVTLPAMNVGVIPVSYTHLDVYKRQDLDNAEAAYESAEATVAMSEADLAQAEVELG